MKRWSDEAWKAALPVYRKILEHPFVGELSAGTLSPERFRFYIRQDALYLDGYARRLAHIASRLARKEHTEAFLRFALDGVEVERALHEQFLGGEHPSPDEISPACLLYTSLLGSQAMAIHARQQGADNPYRRWIETYADPSFAEAAALATRICDELADAAGEETRQRMTELFVRCTRMEWLFWESAWRLETWNI